MSFWQKLFGGKGQPTAPSAQSSRPAAPEQVRQPSICSSAHPAHALALEADTLKGEERIEVIDGDLALSPQDVDLLYAKACALDEISGSGEFISDNSGHVKQFGKLHPSHFDIAMKGKNFGFNRPSPEAWENVFYFNSWSETS
jgi:hypothetical protein